MPETLVPTELSPDDPRWLAFIAHHPDSSIFHHPAWIGVLAECYGYRPALLALLQGERIVAGLPVMEVRGVLRGRRVVALPFSDHCAPLALDDAMLPMLIQELDRFRLERRCDRADVHWQLPAMPGVHAGDPMLLHVTDLPRDSAELLAGFHRTRVQQPIRSAESAGLTSRKGISWSDMLAFYSLHLETRRRLGVPVQPLRFFRLVWERMVARDLAFTLLICCEQKPVAGAVFLRMNDALMYKFSASLPEYWPQYPNHLMLWRAMQCGIEQGCTRFDWGKTDPEHEGLRDFKRGWGSRELAMHGSVLAAAQPAQGVAGRSHALLAQLIRRSPAFVCRAIGEMFYGQFA
jgi:CelD/BcsL family acetyltransferase involved in cellulose biosynthesis